MDAVDRGLLDYAKRRYDNDVEFHAKVHIVAQVLERTGHLHDEPRDLATIAAAVGLAMEWVDPVTGAILDG